MSTNTNAATTAQIALNATPVTVTYEATGQTEEIQIKQLTNRELYKYIKAIKDDDMVSVAAFCAGKPLEWIDTITVESYAAIIGIVRDQNFQKAMAIAAADPVAGVVLLRVATAMGEIASVSLPPELLAQLHAPASSESKAEAGSESSTSPQAAPTS